MSISNQDISSSLSIDSNRIVAFPAGRRNVEWYNSRIMCDDNFRRSFQSAIPSPAGNGTIILDYERASEAPGKLSWIKFLIQGYYFYLSGGADNAALVELNSKLGVAEGKMCLYIWQQFLPGTGMEDREVYNYNEFICKDENNKFRGLFAGENIPDGALGIPIVVPVDGVGDINPAIDATDNGDFYKPWFQSSATWAASEYSDKNKIWVDNKYDVPHICVQIGDKKKWIPLGAVYKTSRNL